MANSDPIYGWLETALATIKKANWYRQPKTITSQSGATVTLNGQSVVNFASNDYLGLAGDRRLIDAAIAATKTLGTGSTGSRLTSGHRQLHRDLEQAIANLKQTEDALVFSSGYLANLGTISAITNKKDLILGDQYNHSSLKNGAKLSGATVLEYDHNDLDALRQLLETHRQNYRRCLITTDSVFSMDGDLCLLPELLAIAKEFSTMLLVDEAHGTGVLGQKGAGVVEHFHCTQQPLIQVGTLSKALGSLGGYVAGSKAMIDFLRNRAPTWIYTTGLSPADTAAALAAIHILQHEPQRRQQLWENIRQLKSALGNHELVSSESAVLCFGLANPQQALTMGDRLLAAGFFAPAIRPPTVPTSRIRVSVMATHSPQQIQGFIEIFQRCFAEFSGSSNL
ncbi:8-amino-7-oxononanoate synthase [Picosynechococcus sp. PCC 73109]|uniref:8-amino-7-oxononanoate synthase n=1 Tax=Picosynechococcus sp. PCC 73109 TaxID=374982 RepID=UPI00074595FB|nr:8-amino-7-oxononanoate synthase [Picosynechococcus sp. PCC 73109]AMA09008.1 8-amino-7-oxononanoate synthase [Picosynechococcus sp. PCC 73109]